MHYTAGEAAAKLGLTKDGLRYYEKEGLLPPITRNESGHRAYSESDIEWIFLIRCLRDTDMTIGRIKQYVSLLMRGGDDSVSERRDILKDHEAILTGKMALYKNLLQLIRLKLKFYDDALRPENSETARCMDYAAEWAHFRSILGGVRRD